MNTNYTNINSLSIDQWVLSGWEWGQPINHDTFVKAKQGDWFVLLTPTKPVPKEWFGDIKNRKILGLASGGGQQMPIFSALGANCTVLDYSKEQLNTEAIVAKREKYEIDIVHADMTKPLPFANESFDLIFHPVSNCYVEDIFPIWKECYRVLKSGGILLTGFDNSINYIFDEDEEVMKYKLPYNPLKDKDLYEDSLKNNLGVQFSHTIEEQIGGQLKAGFMLTDIYQDTNGSGKLHEFNIPTYYATRAVKKIH